MSVTSEFSMSQAVEWDGPVSEPPGPQSVTARTITEVDGSIFVEFQIGDRRAWVRSQNVRELGIWLMTHESNWGACDWNVARKRCEGPRCTNRGPQHVGRLRGAERQARVAEIHEEGLKVADIARKLGWSISTITSDLAATRVT